MVMKSDRGASFSALSACFREHAALVNGVVYDRCGDVAIAEEITAQTFEAAAVRFARVGATRSRPGGSPWSLDGD